MARWKKELPIFEPIELRALVHAAQKMSGSESLDKMTESVLSDLLRQQTERLLRALGFAPGCDWQSAFMRLARIHHGLGRLAHTPKRTNSNAQKYTAEDDARLMKILGDLEAEGVKGPAAFKTIALRPDLRKQFPAYATRSEIRGKDKLEKSLSERARKIRLRQRAFFESRLIAALAGDSREVSEIEALISWLDAQAPAKNEND
jgi:hypothetical protein